MPCCFLLNQKLGIFPKNQAAQEFGKEIGAELDTIHPKDLNLSEVPPKHHTLHASGLGGGGASATNQILAIGRFVKVKLQCQVKPNFRNTSNTLRFLQWTKIWVFSKL